MIAFTDGLKLAVLTAILVVMLVSYLPTGMSYLNQTSVADGLLKPNEKLCESRRSRDADCAGSACSPENFDSCVTAMIKAAEYSKSVCGSYVTRVEECTRRNLNCRIHLENLSACKMAVDVTYAMTIS